MTIQFAAGEVKVLNVQLTPVSGPSGLVISELFIGTRLDTDLVTADDELYIALENPGASVSGIVNIYDWQAWWGNEPGDDRRCKQASFTIAAGGVFRTHGGMHHVTNDLTYFRCEVVVNNVVVLETPRIYIAPGKEYKGTQSIAVGECTYKTSGLAVLWYSQRSECRVWNGNLHTPATQPFQHYVRWGTYRVTDYESIWWPAVFIPIIDPAFISGALYEAYISGGAAGAAWREVWFNFIAA